MLGECHALLLFKTLRVSECTPSSIMHPCLTLQTWIVHDHSVLLNKQHVHLHQERIAQHLPVAAQLVYTVNLVQVNVSQEKAKREARLKEEKERKAAEHARKQAEVIRKAGEKAAEREKKRKQQEMSQVS